MKNGWEHRKLCEVSEVFDGPHATPKTVDEGPIFLGISSLEDGVINLRETRHVTDADFRKWTRRVQPQADDIVFSYETRLGQAAIIPEGLKCCLGRRMGLVRFKKESVLPRFFLYQYISPQFREFLDSKTIRGATVDRISIKDLPSFPIAIPPLAEQQRIVGVLDEAFAGLATAQANAAQNLQNARVLFESHIQAGFTSRGKGWVEKTLGDVAEFKNGLNYTRDSKGQTLPVVGVADFQSNNVVPLGQLQTATIDGELSPEYALRRGDILTVRSNGSRDLVGRCMLVPEVPCTTSYSGFIIRIRVNTAEVFPAFLIHFMKCSDTRDRLTRGGGGANISNINQMKLAALPVSLPSIAEQMEVVAQLDALAAEAQQLTRLYEQKQAALAALKKSLLHQAFAGEL